MKAIKPVKAKLPARMWATVAPDGYVEAAYALRPGQLNPEAKRAGWRRQRVLVVDVPPTRKARTR